MNSKLKIKIRRNPVTSSNTSIQKVLFLILILFLFCAPGLTGDNQVDTKSKLITEILEEFKTKGKEGILNFLKMKKEAIETNFILRLAALGTEKKKKEFIKIALIISEEKNDETTQADVYLKASEYYYSLSNFINASDYADKALKIYLRTDDEAGKSNVYLLKGMIYTYTGDISKALNLYRSALFILQKSNDFSGQGRAYNGIAEIYYLTGENLKALDMYNKALICFEKSRSLKQLGIVNTRKGDMFLRIGNPSKALKMYEKALPIFEILADQISIGTVYLKKGDAYFYIGNFIEALEMYQEALSIFKTVNFITGQGNTLQRIGNIHFYLKDHSRALDIYEEAILLFIKMGDTLAEGKIIRNMGEIYFYSGDNSKALIMYEKAMSLFSKVGYHAGQGNLYLRLGEIYFYTGDNSRALKMYGKALMFFQETNSLLGLGNSYLRKSEVYQRTGNYSKSLDNIQKAMHFIEKTGDPLALGNIFRSRGDIYNKIGGSVRAFEMYDKALSYFTKAVDPIGQGNVYHTKGNIYARSGDHHKALVMFEKALHFFKESGYTRGEGNIYLGKGDVYFNKGISQKAFEQYDKALTIFKKMKDPVGQGDVFIRIGDFYSRSGKSVKAIDVYEKAIKLYRGIGDLESESFTLFKKAEILAKIGKKDDAFNSYEKGIYNLEKIQTRIVFSEMKKTFMRKINNLYKKAVRFMLENNYIDRGFKYTELLKSQVFLHQMAEGLVSVEKGVPPELKEQKDNLVTKLSVLNKSLTQHESHKDKKKFQELKEKYRKTEGELEDLLIKIRLNNPLYASIKYPEPITISKLQKETLKKGEILLSYFISIDEVYVYLVTRKSFKVVHLDLSQKEISNLANGYLNALVENITQRINRYGYKLYQKLFKPLESELKGYEVVIIIPDGELAKMSFESFAISDHEELGRPAFLVERYCIKYIQSASILSLLRQYYHRNRKTNSFIGFGDPIYNFSDFENKKKEMSSFARLNASGDEIIKIANFFKKKSYRYVLYLREQANEENAKAPEMKNFDYIHFACHGLINDDFQSLVLSQLQPDMTKEDGYLTFHEIMNCNYNAKLVVLSSSNTARGKMEKGEGIVGLTRAVMYAGTPAVVASLWYVDDIATKELMTKFYCNLIEKNMNKAEALRQAKIELKRNKKYKSPLFWGGFIMYGE